MCWYADAAIVYITVLGDEVDVMKHEALRRTVAVRATDVIEPSVVHDALVPALFVRLFNHEDLELAAPRPASLAIAMCLLLLPSQKPAQRRYQHRQVLRPVTVGYEDRERWTERRRSHRHAARGAACTATRSISVEHWPHPGRRPRVPLVVEVGEVRVEPRGDQARLLCLGLVARHLGQREPELEERGGHLIVELRRAQEFLRRALPVLLLQVHLAQQVAVLPSRRVLLDGDHRRDLRLGEQLLAVRTATAPQPDAAAAAAAAATAAALLEQPHALAIALQRGRRGGGHDGRLHVEEADNEDGGSRRRPVARGGRHRGAPTRRRDEPASCWPIFFRRSELSCCRCIHA